MKRFAAAALIAGLGAGTASAASITWTVSGITGNVTDVSTAGTLVDSRAGSDLGTGDVVDGTTFVINGVTFDDDFTLDNPTHFDSIGGRASTFTAGNEAYLTLLVNADRNSSGKDDITFTGLVANNVYQIQIWAQDANTNTAAGDRALVLSDGSGAAADISAAGHASVLYNTGGTNKYGQYAIGTFTADGTSQSFKVQRYNNVLTTATTGTNVTVNAVQIRDLGPVPEPGSLALLGLGGLLIARRRRG